jgi:hypothetical protein
MYHYVGGAMGITRKALVKYPNILEYWNCDEGANEYYILHNTSNSTIASPETFIHKFDSKEVFFMNIKMTYKKQDATSGVYLLNVYKACNYILNTSQLSSSFLANFDKELRYFEDNCKPSQ